MLALLLIHILPLTIMAPTSIGLEHLLIGAPPKASVVSFTVLVEPEVPAFRIVGDREQLEEVRPPERKCLPVPSSAAHLRQAKARVSVPVCECRIRLSLVPLTDKATVIAADPADSKLLVLVSQMYADRVKGKRVVVLLEDGQMLFFDVDGTLGITHAVKVWGPNDYLLVLG